MVVIPLLQIAFELPTPVLPVTEALPSMMKNALDQTNTPPPCRTEFLRVI
jgi:hypothetical protein